LNLLFYECVNWEFYDFRYGDIPSPWWQATTVLVGLGSGLSLLLAVTATAACCIAYLIHGRMAKIVGVFQFFSGKSNILIQ
jgi:hypothetical protein